MTEGIGTGHGVITAPYTFFSTAGSVARLGARSFFVDIESATLNIDPQAVRKFIEAECNFDSSTGVLIHKGSGTVVRAIIPVHLYGQCADMDHIMEIADGYNLVVIEDGAQAIGADYPSTSTGKLMRAGSMGHCGCFSFFPTKNLGGFGDGGMVTTHTAEVAEKLRILRAHGSKPKYYHRLVGGNFRLDALQAAVLLVKMKYLDEWTAKRRQNASYYNFLFKQSGLIMDKGFISPPQAVWENMSCQDASNPKFASLHPVESRLWRVRNAEFHRGSPKSKIPNPQSEIRNPQLVGHIYNQYVIRAKDRDDLRTYLKEQGIGTEIYYPLALHQQECFAGLGYKAGDFPESEKATAETLALPIYPELEPLQQEYVVEKIDAFYAA
jgi:dTDP-4-amino-4,6-dideoxygalactose transaminase